MYIETNGTLGVGKGLGTMGYYAELSTLHWGLGIGSDPLSPIVSVLFPVPFPFLFPFPYSMNVS